MLGDARRADQRRQVLGDRADEADLDVAELLDPGRGHGGVAGAPRTFRFGGDVLPLGSAVGVVLGVVGAPSPGRRGRRSPRSSSWLPTAETSRPAALRASMVGLSFWMNDSNVEAPMRSPAAAKTVFGFSRAQLLDRAREDGAHRPRRWWRCAGCGRGSRWSPRIWMSVGAAWAAGAAMTLMPSAKRLSPPWRRR